MGIPIAATIAIIVVIIILVIIIVISIVRFKPSDINGTSNTSGSSNTNGSNGTPIIAPKFLTKLAVDVPQTVNGPTYFVNGESKSASQPIIMSVTKNYKGELEVNDGQNTLIFKQIAPLLYASYSNSAMIDLFIADGSIFVDRHAADMVYFSDVRRAAGALRR
jgi:hypothetical protein